MEVTEHYDPLAAVTQQRAIFRRPWTRCAAHSPLVTSFRPRALKWHFRLIFAIRTFTPTTRQFRLPANLRDRMRLCRTPACWIWY